MKQEILNYIVTLDNPYKNEKIDPLEFVKDIEYNQSENKVNIVINLLGDDDEKNRNLQREITKYIKLDLKILGVKFIVNVNDEKEVSQIADDTKIIAIMSGKGGVGKSQVTANLARALADQGYLVGIIDCDIYGYSIPKILNYYETPEIKEGKIIPPVTPDGIQLISSQYFIEKNENKALIWRGPILGQMMSHFVYDTVWNQNLDYILIDMPPGTGDVLLNIPTYFDKLTNIIVTTPNEDAAHVAERIGQVLLDFNYKIDAVIENMSWYEVDGQKHYIFGQGGADSIAKRFDSQVIGQIPLKLSQAELEDIYADLVRKLIKHLG